MSLIEHSGLNQSEINLVLVMLHLVDQFNFWNLQSISEDLAMFTMSVFGAGESADLPWVLSLAMLIRCKYTVLRYPSVQIGIDI